MKEKLYVIWVIGSKDILDALKNRGTRTNILLMLGMVVFFYWFGTARPFDETVSMVVYDEGQTHLALEKVKLPNGAEYSFREADSFAEMEAKMAHQSAGIILPAGFDQALAAGETPVLQAYVFWADRYKVDELEAQYTRDFSEILDRPVVVEIGENILIPDAAVSGMHTTVSHQLIYFVFWTALSLVPYLMLEERESHTMDALMVSPAGSMEVVAGKALAGTFYVLLVGGLALVLNRVYIIHWGLALLAFLGYVVLAVGLALLAGSYAASKQHLSVWGLVLILLLVIPALFYMEPMLKEGIRGFLTWFPSSALASLFRFSCASGMTAGMLLPNLAVVAASIGVVFWLVNRKVQQAAQ